MLGLVGVAGFAMLLVIAFVHGEIPAPFAFILGVWLPGAVAAAVRQAMLGVYVSDGGIRSRSFWRTTTVPWASVSDIRSGTATMAGLDMGRVAIIIERTDGALIQTPLQRGYIFRLFEFNPGLGRLATWPEHYDEILATLQAHHRDAQRPLQTPPIGQLAYPSAATRPARPSAGVSGTRPTGDALTADKRRDIHALTRQHERGALTDAEYAAELAKIHGIDHLG